MTPRNHDDAAALKRQVVVRYRAPGHVRFQLPTALCGGACGEYLLTALRAVDGVYRVDVYPGQGKLSIRYREPSCDFIRVARALNWAIDGGGSLLVAAAQLPSRPAWLRGKYQEVKETWQAVQVLKRRVALQAGATPEQRERFVLEFLNDVLVFYLTKVHWNAITTLWMRNPWRHRYEWLATFYMVYLLVRWRRSKR
ncbi:MAG: cation transporter [Methylococcaceae bacterium]|nr:MAG: cation transporter [Methylococcaceae bacterium]